MRALELLLKPRTGLAWLGGGTADADTARQLRVAKAGAFIGVGMSASWAIGQIAVGWPSARVNVAAFVAYLSVLAVLAAGFGRLARHLLFWVAVLHVLGLAFTLAGTSGAVHVWFVLFAVAANLLFSPREHRWRIGYGLGSLAAFAVMHLGWVPLPVLPEVRPGMFKFVAAANLLTVAGSIFGLVQLFLRDLDRAESQNERLLLNVLPRRVVERLREGNAVIADGHSEVTVLFADLVGFTPLSGKLPATELVQLLDRIFSAFDDLATELQLEKIKTIGDAYMVAAGVPESQPDGARRVAEMALRMRDVLATIRREVGVELALRIGIHTGPAVAGVIGKSKFAYDLWGETVNLAARMESHGLPGEIQLSLATSERLGAGFVCAPRGLVTVKGKGEMETFWLTGRQ
ncbi:MAG: adenylate/guanylate cyclase domain-containing protein [Archangium sp.]|nr:adenylate/guanylate cyclase domain-containing protein [Archangium sp.]